MIAAAGQKVRGAAARALQRAARTLHGPPPLHCLRGAPRAASPLEPKNGGARPRARRARMAPRAARARRAAARARSPSPLLAPR